MHRTVVSILICLSAAACSTAPYSNPEYTNAGRVDIGQGVGLGSYESYEAQRLGRERELRGQADGGSVATGPAATGQGGTPAISSDELRAAGLPSAGGALPATEPVSAQPISSGPAAAPQGAPSTPGGISDEQSFAAVASRETIESDAERLARQRAAYQVIQPTAVPTRSGSQGPNIVQYALTTTNRVGQPVYRRGGLFQDRKFRRACLKYPSSDLAQEAFLAQGGPEKDRLGVDPDGDGFACAWNPAPYRAARS